MSIAQLCNYLQSTPRGQILSLVRRKEIGGVKHEFLVMHALEPSGKQVWLRVERAAKRAPSGIRTLFSTFPARDTVSCINNINGAVASTITVLYISLFAFTLEII